MKKLLVSFLMLVLVVACSPQSGDTVKAPEASAVGTAGPSIDNVTSFDELNALGQRYMRENDYHNAYLAGKKMAGLAPEKEEGYKLAVMALLALSKGNYKEIDTLIGQAAVAMPDATGLFDEIKAAEPKLVISWPFISDTAPGDENNAGNTCGNISSGGLVAVQGKWAYYGNRADEGRLYKIKPLDTSGRQKLCDDTVAYLNVVGDYIYYCNLSDGNAIYSIRTDGSERTKLCSEWCEFLSVRDGWIYYGAESDSGSGIYKMRTDGSGKTVISNKHAKYPSLYGDWIYFCSKNDSGSLWRVPVSGGGPQCLIDKPTSYFAIFDGRIYGLEADDRVVFSINTEGNGKTEHYKADGEIAAFNVFDGYLFVSGRLKGSSGNEADRLLFIDLATGEPAHEIECRSKELYCSERLVFYVDYADGERIYRVDMNNWNVAKINE